jgi:hypothetical protein
MDAVIRLTKLADIDAIFKIRTSVRENHLSQDQLTEIGITPEAISQAISETPCAWVAEVSGVPVGFRWSILKIVAYSRSSSCRNSKGMGWGAI